MRGLWPGGGYEGRPRLSPEDVWGGEEVGGRAEGVWGVRISYANFARHVRSCRAGGRGAAALGDGGGGVVVVGGGADNGGGVGRGGAGLLGANGVGRERGGGGEGVGRRVSCQFCGRELTVRNMVRHLRQSCRVWDPGGGADRVQR